MMIILIIVIKSTKKTKKTMINNNETDLQSFLAIIYNHSQDKFAHMQCTCFTPTGNFSTINYLFELDDN